MSRKAVKKITKRSGAMELKAPGAFHIPLKIQTALNKVALKQGFTKYTLVVFAGN